MANAQLTEQQMNPVGNGLAPIVGPVVASAAGVVALGAYAIQHISGALAITGFTPPFADFVGTLAIVPDGTFTWTTATNIALAGTAVVNKTIFFTFDGTKWTPSVVA